VAECRSVRPGFTAVREAGPGGRQYHVPCSAACVRVLEGVPRPPGLELIGGLKQIQGVVSGRSTRANTLWPGLLDSGATSVSKRLGLELSS
jgi:hypothetical protein